MTKPKNECCKKCEKEEQYEQHGEGYSRYICNNPECKCHSPKMTQAKEHDCYYKGFPLIKDKNSCKCECHSPKGNLK